MVDKYPSVEDLIQSTNCSFCVSTFSNSSARRLHEIKKHNSINCDSDKRLREPQSFANDTKTVESVCNRFFCPYSECPKFYSTKKLLTQHYMKTHNPKDEECDQCGLRFALKRDRIYHQKKRCPNRRRMDDDGSIKKKKSGEKATVIRRGATTVILLEAQTTESLMEGILAELNRNANDKVDGMSQTDDIPPSLSQHLITDSMSQSIQTVQYPPFLETRHVETSIDMDFDDFRHIETQTLPLWSSSPVDINRYWNA